MNQARTPGHRIGRTLGHLVVASALCVALAACGSDDSSERSDDRSTTDATTSETPSASASATPSATTSESPSGTPSSQTSGAAEPSPTQADLELGTVSARDLSAVIAAAPATGTQTLNGKLIIAEAGCLHLTSRTGPPTLLAFPAGAEIDADRKPTMIVDSVRYPVGTRLSLAGEKRTLNAVQKQQIAPCSTRGEVFQIAKIG